LKKWGGVPARWFLLSVELPPPGREYLVVEALRNLGARGVERVGARVVAHFPPPPDPEGFAARAGARLAAVSRSHPGEVRWRWRSREEWIREWLEEMETRRIGGRIEVTAAAPEGSGGGGSPEATGELPRGEEWVTIRLRPGVGFGTGGHPTTRLVLERLLHRVQRDDRIVDVGAGSGIVSVAAALLRAERVWGLERDPLAVATAQGNVAENGVEGRVRIERTEVGPDGPRGLEGVTGVVANLQGDALGELLPGLSRLSGEGGWLLLSGVNRGERNGIVEAAEEAGLVLEEEGTEEGWWVGSFRRRG